MFARDIFEKFSRPSRPGGGLNESYNQVAQDALQRKLLEAETKSKSAYAQYLPYQLQAQALSNPLLWMALKDNPEAAKGLLNTFQQSIPKPNYDNQNNDPFLNIIGWGLHKLGIGGKNTQPQVPVNQNTSTNGEGGSYGGTASPNDQQIKFNEAALKTGGDAEGVPGATIPPYRANDKNNPPKTSGRLVAKPGAEGVVTKMTAPYTESPYKGNAIVSTPQGAVTTPGAGLIESSQNLDIALKNITPLLNDIANGAEKWSLPGMQGKLKAAHAINLIRKNVGDIGGLLPKLLKQTGLNTKDITDYADYEANQEKVVDTLMSLYNLPKNELSLQTVKKIVHPLPGEGKEYKDRIQKELKQLQRRAKVTREAVSEGSDLFPSPNKSSPNISKSDINEENIRHTMEVTGLSREQVLKKLKERGLI